MQQIHWFYLRVFKDVMRFVTLRDDCNTLLHMVPQQYLGEHQHHWQRNTHTHTHTYSSLDHTDLCRAASVLLGYIGYNWIIQELVWIGLSSEPEDREDNKTGKGFLIFLNSRLRWVVIIHFLKSHCSIFLSTDTAVHFSLFFWDIREPTYHLHSIVLIFFCMKYGFHQTTSY